MNRSRRFLPLKLSRRSPAGCFHVAVGGAHKPTGTAMFRSTTAPATTAPLARQKVRLLASQTASNHDSIASRPPPYGPLPAYPTRRERYFPTGRKRNMFGPFRVTNPLSGGLLWKIPWRLSRFQKRRHRLRLRAVDSVVATLDSALAKKGQTLEALERWKAEMPTEAEMLPKDKYTMFDRKVKRYRKGIHSTFLSASPPPPLEGSGRVFFWRGYGEIANLVVELPKWTRVSQRLNPPGY